MSRVILFGSRGFIGSHILARLNGCDVLAPARGEVDLLSLADIKRTVRRGDVVVNAAGYAQAADRTPEGVKRLQAANVQAVANVAKACEGIGISQLIHISSVAAMGRLTGAHHGEDAVGPIRSPYAESKRQAEAALADFRGALPVTILRPTSVFGEGRGLAATLCRVAQLPVVPLPGGGRVEIPFTYVKNVADAVVMSIGSEAAVGETFIIGDARSYPLRDIISALAERLGSRPRILGFPTAAASFALRIQPYMPRPVRDIVGRARLETLTTSVSYSIQKFQAATGYRPRYSLEDAVQRLADWHASATGAGRGDA